MAYARKRQTYICNVRNAVIVIVGGGGFIGECDCNCKHVSVSTEKPLYNGCHHRAAINK